MGARRRDGATGIAFGDGDEKVAAVADLAVSAEPAARLLLQALADGTVQVSGDRVIIVEGDRGIDAASGAKIDPLPESRDDVIVNNRVRGAIDNALAALKLFDPSRKARAHAADALADSSERAMRPLIASALARETDRGIRETLEHIVAGMDLHSPEASVRLQAVERLGDSGHPRTEVAASRRDRPPIPSRTRRCAARRPGA